MRRDQRDRFDKLLHAYRAKVNKDRQEERQEILSKNTFRRWFDARGESAEQEAINELWVFHLMKQGGRTPDAKAFIEWCRLKDTYPKTWSAEQLEPWLAKHELTHLLEGALSVWEDFEIAVYGAPAPPTSAVEPGKEGPFEPEEEEGR